MKPEEMMKIRGLYQSVMKLSYKGKKIKRGPYWFGWYMENGKQIRVYIGKDLPKHLQWLLDERVMLPGRKQWQWPAYKPAKRQSTQALAPTQEL